MALLTSDVNQAALAERNDDTMDGESTHKEVELPPSARPQVVNFALPGILASGNDDDRLRSSRARAVRTDRKRTRRNTCDQRRVWIDDILELDRGQAEPQKQAAGCQRHHVVPTDTRVRQDREEDGYIQHGT